MLNSNTMIVCPRGKKGTDPIIIDLTEVYPVEARLHEVAIVTKTKAPELLSTFNRAYAAVFQQRALLEMEKNTAKREAEKLRAIIILDKVPQILQEKKLATAKSPAGSEDLRQAILALDPEYQEALERVEQITCVIELLTGKLKALENGFTSVKKIMTDDAFNMAIGKNSLSGDSGSGPVGIGLREQSPEDAVVESEEAAKIAPPKALRPGFGKAKY